MVDALVKEGASLDTQEKVGVYRIKSCEAGMYYGSECVPRSIYHLSAVCC